jgi:UDP-glucose 4-epimerase
MNLSATDTVMVTGAAGFIGSHLSDLLAERGCRLVLVDDFSIGRRENLAQLERRAAVRIVKADVTDRAAMVDLMRGVDVVFHLAISCLRTSINRPFMSHDVNGGGTLAACLAAIEHRVKRFVYVSSSEVYGTAITVPMAETHPLNPTTVYGASKLAGELYALACWRTYGLPAMVIRPFNTYGPREPWRGARAEVIPRFLLQLEAGRSPVIYGDGTQTRDFTFVSDTVRGMVQAAECDALVGDVVNVAYGSEVSIGRIAELLAELTGRREVPITYAAPRPGDVHRHYADAAKARRLFGFAPQIDVETGLDRTIAWFRGHGFAAADVEAAGVPNW